MTSRFSATKLMKAIDAGQAKGDTYELAPTNSVFGFANAAAS
jgi:hypothetical protein